MEYPIIDAHAHLWLRQDAVWDGKPIRTLDNGRSDFLGEVRQMVPPFMTDGCNSAERLIANMDYAQVGGAVITQEYIDGLQNDYLETVQRRWPDRFLCCAMPDLFRDDAAEQSRALLDRGFRALKIPAHRLLLSDRRIYLTDKRLQPIYQMLEERDALLSIDLAEGALQVAEMEEIISACPRLRIAIGHFGMANRPDWMAQIKLARHPRVRIESGGITWLYNDEFYPFAGAVRAIREAIDTVGADKVMWGSDYPRTIVAITYRMSYDFVRRSTLLTPEEQALFLGGNAQAFYGFGPLPELPYIKNMSE